MDLDFELLAVRNMDHSSLEMLDSDYMYCSFPRDSDSFYDLMNNNLRFISDYWIDVFSSMVIS